MLIGRKWDLDLTSLPQNVKIAPDHFSHLSGYTIAKLGAQKISTGEIIDIDSVEPNYYQDFVAGKPKKLLDIG